MKWNREDLKAWTKIPTRWMDDDIYGHVNNVVYYSYFDTAVNGNLIRATGQDIRSQDAIGIVVESGLSMSIVKIASLSGGLRTYVKR